MHFESLWVKDLLPDWLWSFVEFVILVLRYYLFLTLVKENVEGD
jgi:hypothetical protein